MYNHDVKDEEDWYGYGLVRLLETFVMTVLLYGGESWSVLDKDHNPLCVFCMRICCISLRDHITNQDMLRLCESFLYSMLTLTLKARGSGG